MIKRHTRINALNNVSFGARIYRRTMLSCTYASRDAGRQRDPPFVYFLLLEEKKEGQKNEVKGKGKGKWAREKGLQGKTQGIRVALLASAFVQPEWENCSIPFL